MALTLKRKSLKKTSKKKNVHFRKRNNKTIKNMKTSETMRGGANPVKRVASKKVTKSVIKKHIKTNLLSLEEHSKKTADDLKKFKKSQEWKKLQREAYTIIKQKMAANQNFKNNNIMEKITTVQ